MSKLKQNNKIVKCRECNRNTIHEILHSVIDKNKNGLLKPYDFDVKHYKIIKCLGCETISFCLSSHLSSNKKVTLDFLYPLRERHNEKDFKNLPENIWLLYHETIRCFNYFNRILCVAGIRATIEAICLDKSIGNSSTNLKTKINLLEENKYITSHLSNAIQKLRIIGNSALHEIRTPSQEVLSTAIELLEDTLNYIYEIPHKGNKI